MTDELSAHIENISNAVEQDSTDYNETATRGAIINPLLRALGWSLMPPEVQMEYNLQMGRTSGNVDYALCIDSVPVAFVEAKPLRDSLTEQNRGQLQSYMKQADVNVGLLTNGSEYEVFLRTYSNNSSQVNLAGTYSWNELAAPNCKIDALSRESVQDQNHEKIFEREVKRKQTLDQLQEDEPEIVDGIVSVLSETLDNSFDDQYEIEARELVSGLKHRIDDSPEKTTDGGTVAETETTAFWETVEDEIGIRCEPPDEMMEFEKENGPRVFTFPADKTYTEAFREYVELLFEIGVLSMDDVPMEIGKSRYLLSMDGKTQTGEDAQRTVRLSNDVYVDVNYSSLDFEQRILELSPVTPD